MNRQNMMNSKFLKQALVTSCMVWIARLYDEGCQNTLVKGGKTKTNGATLIYIDSILKLMVQLTLI